MAITAAMRQDIMELAVLMNNKAPGTKLLGELVVAANGGATLEQIAASNFTTSHSSRISLDLYKHSG